MFFRANPTPAHRAKRVLTGIEPVGNTRIFMGDHNANGAIFIGDRRVLVEMHLLV